MSNSFLTTEYQNTQHESTKDEKTVRFLLLNACCDRFYLTPQVSNSRSLEVNSLKLIRPARKLVGIHVPDYRDKCLRCEKRSANLLVYIRRRHAARLARRITQPLLCKFARIVGDHCSPGSSEADAMKTVIPCRMSAS